MSKIISLKRNSDFQRLYRKGKSAVRRTMVVYSAGGIKDKIRLGITASKKIGGAVLRNRAKRRIRELFRNAQVSIIPGKDVCIVARSAIISADAARVKKDFESAVSELGLNKS